MPGTVAEGQSGSLSCMSPFIYSHALSHIRDVDTKLFNAM